MTCRGAPRNRAPRRRPDGHLRTPVKIFKSIDNFNVADPRPGVALDDIQPASERAFALLIRNRTKPLLKEGFVNIVGAIEMLSGLEYHHDNIVRLSERLASGTSLDETDLNHEAVAYLNRLGQFHYFAKSALASKGLPHATAIIPTVEKYMLFRMKHAAHRSIDRPQGETEDAQILQAISLTRAAGRMMTLKPGATNTFPAPGAIPDAGGMAEFRRLQWQSSYLTFQIYDEDGQTHINLIIEKEHPQICREVYGLLSAIVLWEPTSPPPASLANRRSV